MRFDERVRHSGNSPKKAQSSRWDTLSVVSAYHFSSPSGTMSAQLERRRRNSVEANDALSSAAEWNGSLLDAASMAELSVQLYDASMAETSVQV